MSEKQERQVRLLEMGGEDYGPFRGSFRLDLADPVNIFLGPGGNGKTHLSRLPGHCVTGIADGLTDRTKKALREIPFYGSSRATIYCRFSGVLATEPVRYSRLFTGWTPKDQRVSITTDDGTCVNCSLPTDKCKCTNEVLERWFYERTCTAAQWRLLLDAAKVCQLSATDIAGFIFSLTGGGITADEVRAEVVKLNDPYALKIWDEYRKKSEEDVLDFERLQGRMIRQRPDYTRRVEDLRTVLAEGTVAFTEDMEKELATLTLTKEGLDGRLTAAIKAGVHRKELENLEKADAEYQTVDIAAMTTRLDELKKQVEQAEAKKRIDPTAQVRETEKAWMAAKAGTGECCPTCGRKLTKSIADALARALDELRAEEREYQEWKIELEGAKFQVREQEQLIMQARTDANVHAATTKRIEELTTALSGAEEEQAIRDELEKTTKKIAPLTEAKEKKSNRERAEKRLKEAEAEADGLQKLINAYGPTAIRATLTKGEGFKAEVQKALGLVFDGNPESKDVVIDLQQQTISFNGGKQWKPFVNDGISESFQMRLGAAFQLGIAKSVGVWVLCSDRTAEIDPGSWRRLLGSVRGSLRTPDGKPYGTAIYCRQLPDVPGKTDDAKLLDEVTASYNAAKGGGVKVWKILHDKATGVSRIAE